LLALILEIENKIMKTFLIISQLIVSALLITFILLQQRGTALGSAFGGSGSEGFYSTRRGLEKKLYWASIIFGALFIILALINLFLS